MQLLTQAAGAQSAGGQSLGTIGGPTGLGPFGNIGTSTDTAAGATGITNIISSVLGFMTVTAAVWFLFQILFAGYAWMSAGGEAKKLQEARDRIVHSFMGLVIVVGAWSLLAVVGQFFGFNSLINPADLVKQLSIPSQ